jgi:hypothetical protein
MSALLSVIAHICYTPRLPSRFENAKCATWVRILCCCFDRMKTWMQRTLLARSHGTLPYGTRAPASIRSHLTGATCICVLFVIALRFHIFASLPHHRDVFEQSRVCAKLSSPTSVVERRCTPRQVAASCRAAMRGCLAQARL